MSKILGTVKNCIHVSWNTVGYFLVVLLKTFWLTGEASSIKNKWSYLMIFMGILVTTYVRWYQIEAYKG